MNPQMHETENRDGDSGHTEWCWLVLVATIIRAGGIGNAAAAQREREGGKRATRTEQLTVERARLQTKMAEINIRLRRLARGRSGVFQGRCVA